MTLAITPPPFVKDALCGQTDPDAFYPEPGGSPREAKLVCRACEVSTECLAWALENDQQFGIWGGLTARERQQLRRAGGTRTAA
ncbi:WhiB family transcriptional regulator [Streptomyces sp. NPDC046332]|uniref:WhiB family transcriptional regulator n=1 Tax=unclassified Streptomyces TaxID=2593676 RepID=UPI0033D45FBC